MVLRGLPELFFIIYARKIIEQNNVWREKYRNYFKSMEKGKQDNM